MPYDYRKKGDKYFCYNKDTGEMKDTKGHDTEAEAKAHLRALYAAESGTKMTGKRKIRVKRKKKA